MHEGKKKAIVGTVKLNNPSFFMPYNLPAVGRLTWGCGTGVPDSALRCPVLPSPGDQLSQESKEEEEREGEGEQGEGEEKERERKRRTRRIEEKRRKKEKNQEKKTRVKNREKKKEEEKAKKEQKEKRKRRKAEPDRLEKKTINPTVAPLCVALLGTAFLTA